MRVKHNKLRNSGIIYELLVSRLTNEILSGKDSPALNIIKEYFTNTEIAKEYKLYKVLVTSFGNDSKINSLIETTIGLHKNINKTSLRKQHYNLIKEIKNNYDIESFFKAKITNYKIFASIYTLFESFSSNSFSDPEDIVKNKIIIYEHLAKKSAETEAKDMMMEEYLKSDKGTRFLTYKIFVEKFNDKYSELDNTQKEILKEYINNTNHILLKEYINEKFIGIKQELKQLTKKVIDKTILIKLNEVISIIKPIDKAVKDDDVLNLLNYTELVKEIKIMN